VYVGALIARQLDDFAQFVILTIAPIQLKFFEALKFSWCLIVGRALPVLCYTCVHFVATPEHVLLFRRFSVVARHAKASTEVFVDLYVGLLNILKYDHPVMLWMGLGCLANAAANQVTCPTH
jgi:hypothetical protein